MKLGIADIIILILVAAAVTAAVIYIRRQRKKGRCAGCSGDCSNCGTGGRVHRPTDAL